MALISLAQARAHVRVEIDYPEEQLQAFIDGAVDAAQRYLNRSVYETQNALDAARDTYVSEMKAAAEALEAARDAAEAIDDQAERCATLRLAEREYEEASATANACIDGVVITPSIRAAMLLLLGHLFAHRETVVVGAPVAELPYGVQNLLRPFRKVMMP